MVTLSWIVCIYCYHVVHVVRMYVHSLKLMCYLRYSGKSSGLHKNKPEQVHAVEPLLMATPDEWPPLYYGHSPWCPLHRNSTYKIP